MAMSKVKQALLCVAYPFATDEQGYSDSCHSTTLPTGPESRSRSISAIRKDNGPSFSVSVRDYWVVKLSCSSHVLTRKTFLLQCASILIEILMHLKA